MSQSSDLEAIDHYMNTQPTHTAAARHEVDRWITWYKGLGSWERSMDGAVLAEAKRRRDTFNNLNFAAPASTTAAATPTPAVITAGAKPTIRRGSTGEAVKEWQRFLKIAIDGNFGSGTEAATKAFQSARGLTADGIVGPKTWAAAQSASLTTPTTTENAAAAAATLLQPPVNPVVTGGTKPTLRRGSTGETVKSWQRFLKIADDGIFGPATETATKLFQKANGLTQDGIVGPNTWAVAQRQSGAVMTQPSNPAQAAAQAAAAAAAAAAASIPDTSPIVESFFPSSIPSPGEVVETVKTTVIDLHSKTPLWAKVAGGVLGGIAAIAGVKAMSKKRARA